MKQQMIVIRADWEDMVFQQRETDYGAYALRRSYDRTLGTALLITATLAMIFVGVHIYWQSITPMHLPPAPIATKIDLSEVPTVTEPPQQEIIPPPTPPDPPQIAITAANIPAPTPPDDLEDPDASIATIDTLAKADNLGFVDQEGEKVAADPFAGLGGEGTSIPEAIRETEPDPGVFQPGIEPKPVNLSEVQKLIGYPPMAIEAQLEGIAVARVLVDKRGRYRKHIWSGRPQAIFVEAIEPHLSKLRFTPAIQGNKPIMFWVNIPFSFSLVKE